MPDFLTPERLILVVAFLYIVHLLWHKHKKRIKSWYKNQKAKLPRHWKPKSPEDCHACGSNIQLSQAIPRNVQPWSQRKSSRGRKKAVSSQDLACLNKDCEYYGIRDENIHVIPVL